REGVLALALLLYTLDTRRRGQTERYVRCAQNMARHVADRATAEVGESAPMVRGVRRAEGTILGPTQPRFPIKGRRNGSFRGHDLGTLRPILPRPVGPGVDFGDSANIAIPDHLAALARAFIGIALIPHLGRDPVFGRRPLQLLRLPYGAGQRLLTV